MTGKVYKITNKINGKSYIGKTYGSVDQRFKEHVKDSKSERCKNRPLYRAFNKYGIENFEVETLGEFGEGILEDIEIELIQEHDTYKNGYNATLGGDGRRWLGLVDKVVIEKYKELNSIKLTAEYFECTPHTVRLILKNNNTPITKAPHIIGVKLIKGNVIKEFESYADAGKWLIDEGHCNIKAANSGDGVSLAIRRGTYKYLGFDLEKVV